MVARIYLLFWFVAFAFAVFLHFSDSLNEVTYTALGFGLATLFFGFFVAVLPWWVDKVFEPKYHKLENSKGLVS